MKRKLVLVFVLIFVMLISACGTSGALVGQNEQEIISFFDRFEMTSDLLDIEDDFRAMKVKSAFEKVSLERISVWKETGDFINILKFAGASEKFFYENEVVLSALRESLNEDEIRRLGTAAVFGLTPYVPENDADNSSYYYESYWYDPLGKAKVKKGSIGTYFHRTIKFELGDFVLTDEEAYWYASQADKEIKDDNGIEHLNGSALYYGDALISSSDWTLFEFMSELGLIKNGVGVRALMDLYDSVSWGETELSWDNVWGAKENYVDTVYVFTDQQGNLCLIGICDECYVMLYNGGMDLITLDK